MGVLDDIRFQHRQAGCEDQSETFGLGMPLHMIVAGQDGFERRDPAFIGLHQKQQIGIVSAQLVGHHRILVVRDLHIDRHRRETSAIFRHRGGIDELDLRLRQRRIGPYAPDIDGDHRAEHRHRRPAPARPDEHRGDQKERGDIGHRLAYEVYRPDEPCIARDQRDDYGGKQQCCQPEQYSGDGFHVAFPLSGAAFGALPFAAPLPANKHGCPSGLDRPGEPCFR